MELNKRIEAFSRLGNHLSDLLKDSDPSNPESEIAKLLLKAYQKNNWFTPESIRSSLGSIISWLNEENLRQWLAPYKTGERTTTKRIGVIMAGNIPLVGFHDFLCVMLAGYTIDAKLSSDDPYLLPAVADWLIKIEPGFESRIFFSSKIEKPDAVIATGSNNSARYFDYYFGRYPHIIRANRNSVAVLTGEESDDELKDLGKDIFSYFGLGCRNVSKLYIPEKYNFDRFYQNMQDFSYVMQHNKYMNNYDYHNALFLLNSVPFLTNNFLIVKEHESLSTPVSVLHYEYYTSANDLNLKLKNQQEHIQCIAGKNYIPFGKTQEPTLSDYADGKDVMKFLIDLK